ncbi:MAG: hypothetical protein BWY57_02789 [Betaproteobacteria bacterium ADurb.Bin341]|nr:MAG: hypothetical protein BWY57_02789 [Betaproteobacteria bacterium ADurb.Bin341]
MQFEPNRRAARQTGFSLVELMVGMAIGLFLVLVITQVLGVFEARNRATIGNADAQTNGGIALYTIGRDLQMAGFSLMPIENSALECTSFTPTGVTGITGSTPAAIANEVSIAGGSGTSDTITIRYGSSMKGGTFTQVIGIPDASNNVPVKSNLGCRRDEVAMIVRGTACILRKVTGPVADPSKPNDTSTPYEEYDLLTGNDTITLNNVSGISVDDNLTCLGVWNEVTYAVAVDNGSPTLMRNGVPILSGIVNLQAQYGISGAADINQVSQWVDASGAWAAPSVANRNLIKAVRLAVVARNDKRDAAVVTSACSSTTAAAPTGLCAWAGSAGSPAPAIDLSSADADWQHYRYRVFETVIPLRNVVWSKDTL